MLTHHTLECAKARLNPESHWLVNGSFLLSFCKKYLLSVTSLWCTLVNPFVVVHPTHILMHSRVHRAHRSKSADLGYGRHGSCHGRHFDGGAKIAWHKLKCVTCSSSTTLLRPMQQLNAQLPQHSALYNAIIEVCCARNLKHCDKIVVLWHNATVRLF